MSGGRRLALRVGEELVATGTGRDAVRTTVRASAVVEMREAGTTFTWEEWQLLGHDGSDVWLEYDHDERELTLYRPTESVPPVVDLAGLHRGRQLDLRLDGRPHRLTVRERGTGTVRSVEGTFAEPFVPGQQVEYADLTGHGVVVSVERTTGPLGPVTSVYAGRRLDVAEQTRLFGRRLTPRSRSGGVVAAVVGAFVLLLSFGACQASRADDASCTPRSVVTTAPASGTPAPATTDSTSCYRRTLYGGGGVGK
ncbi:DUF4178 domain-containing protein [Cellulosimicrobium sp. Marseille-Q4280]|uniref:DUF4178 domain-containing protein n=1 Tax=Cellulosimicrobium sp. Marseille-Q4280 TaxID=2937992 RepID=UPI00203EF9E1|nr:DUF4178 domain-containing protein [Cellulosimicrobium sp. Marseille-Q4280]